MKKLYLFIIIMVTTIILAACGTEKAEVIETEEGTQGQEQQHTGIFVGQVDNNSIEILQTIDDEEVYETYRIEESLLEKVSALAERGEEINVTFTYYELAFDGYVQLVITDINEVA